MQHAIVPSGDVERVRNARLNGVPESQVCPQQEEPPEEAPPEKSGADPGADNLADRHSCQSGGKGQE